MAGVIQPYCNLGVATLGARLTTVADIYKRVYAVSSIAPLAPHPFLNALRGSARARDDAALPSSPTSKIVEE